MAKKNYEEMSKQILEYVGGKENISFFTHCVTRLRFNVRDKSLVQKDKIEKVNGVIGVQWSGEQLQIIVGQQVTDIYSTICNISGLQPEQAIDENLDGKKHKENIINMFFRTLSDCLSPTFPALIGCGLIKALMTIFTMLNLVETTSTTYQTLSFISDAAFYFLPFLVTIGSARRFKCNPAIAMVLAGVLLHPNFVALVNASQESGEVIKFFAFTIPNVTYSSTCFPIILSVYCASKIEHLIDKYSPNAIKLLAKSALPIIIVAPLSLIVLAPLGNMAGQVLPTIVDFLRQYLGVFTPAIIAAVLALTIMTGMHYPLIVYGVSNFTSTGVDTFFYPAHHMMTYTIAASALAVAIKSKKSEVKEMGFSSVATTIFGGVTEPALFGILLKYRKPLYAQIIGAFSGGLVVGILGTKVYNFPSNPLLYPLCYLNDADPTNIIKMAIGFVVGCAVTFVISYITHKDEE